MRGFSLFHAVHDEREAPPSILPGGGMPKSREKPQQNQVFLDEQLMNNLNPIDLLFLPPAMPHFEQL